MTTITEDRRVLLERILCVQSYSKEEDMMRSEIIAILKEYRATLTKAKQRELKIFQKEGNIFVTKGKIKKKEKYPCIACHTDTVHRIIKQYDVFEYNGYYYAMDGVNIEQTGIGGDDKVGIFIALEMLLTKDVLKACFFCEEEIGLLGVGRAPISFFKDCGYVLECDRKGDDDFVNSIGNTTLYGDKFSKAVAPIIKKYGYSESFGGSTDVAAIKRKLDICVANMSCGYFHPHSDREVVHTESVMRTANMVSDLMKKLGNKLWEYKYVPVVYSNNSKSNNYGGKKVNRFTSWDCGICGTQKQWVKEVSLYACPKCFPPKKEEKGKVKQLGIASEVKDADGKTCPVCKTASLNTFNVEGRLEYWCWKCMCEINSELVEGKQDDDNTDTYVAAIHKDDKGKIVTCPECRGVESYIFMDCPNDYQCATCDTFFSTEDDVVVKPNEQ